VSRSWRRRESRELSAACEVGSGCSAPESGLKANGGPVNGRRRSSHRGVTGRRRGGNCRALLASRMYSQQKGWEGRRRWCFAWLERAAGGGARRGQGLASGGRISNGSALRSGDSQSQHAREKRPWESSRARRALSLLRRGTRSSDIAAQRGGGTDCTLSCAAPPARSRRAPIFCYLYTVFHGRAGATTANRCSTRRPGCMPGGVYKVAANDLSVSDAQQVAR
jgi:hypothetical protein